MNKNLSSNKAGFTLVELLVVIAIIGTLTGISLVAYNLIFNEGAGKTTKVRIDALDTALEKYRIQDGAIPDQLIKLADGGENSSEVLYRILFNDGVTGKTDAMGDPVLDANGDVDLTAPTGEPDYGTIKQTYLPALDPATGDNKLGDMVKLINGKYLILDANRQPIRVFIDNTKRKGAYNSFKNGIDIWSVGTDGVTKQGSGGEWDAGAESKDDVKNW